METKLTKADAFVEIDAARRDLQDVLDRLDDADWDAPTLCEGWRVREVVSHVASAPDARLSRVFPKIIAARGRVDVMLDRMARDGGARPVDEIREHHRRNLEARTLPPGVPPQQFLTDVVIHSLDITTPNGWDLELPVERIRLALSTLVNLGGPFRGRQRAEGLHCDTTDIDWRAGCGDHVRGPSRSMLLALAGRKPMCRELTGDGVEALRTR